MAGQNSNIKYSTYNEEHNYIMCPSGFRYYLSFTGRIPFHVLIDDELGATDIKLYGIIEGLCYAFNGLSKNTYVSNNDFCFLLGLSENSTAYERSLKKLKEKNLVKREKKTITEKGRTFRAWCWSIESGNFYTLINDNKQQDPHQEWGTEDKTPTCSGVPDPHQEWGQIADNKITEKKKAAPPKKAPSHPYLYKDYILVFMEVMLLHPHPNPDKPSAKLIKAMNAMFKEWATKVSDNNSECTPELFRSYLHVIKSINHWLNNHEKFWDMSMFCKIEHIEHVKASSIAKSKQQRGYA